MEDNKKTYLGDGVYLDKLDEFSFRLWTDRNGIEDELYFDLPMVVSLVEHLKEHDFIPKDLKL